MQNLSLTQLESTLLLITAPLCLLLIILLIKNNRLQKALSAEKNKRVIPSLCFAYDLYAPALYLKNTSANFICDIVIEPFELDADVGFRKRLRIELPAIARLSADEPLPLNPQITDSQGPLHPKQIQAVIPILKTSDFELRAHCKNSEGTPFFLTLKNSKGGMELVRAIAEN